MLLSGLLEQMIRIGTLEVIDADGRPHVFRGAALTLREADFVLAGHAQGAGGETAP